MYTFVHCPVNTEDLTFDFLIFFCLPTQKNNIPRNTPGHGLVGGYSRKPFGSPWCRDKGAAWPHLKAVRADGWRIVLKTFSGQVAGPRRGITCCHGAGGWKGRVLGGQFGGGDEPRCLAGRRKDGREGRQRGGAAV